MTTAIVSNAVRHEGRVLFALIDSAQDFGLLAKGDVARGWSDLRAVIVAADDYERWATDLYELLLRASAAGMLSGSWIEGRFDDVMARVGRGDESV